MTPLAVTFWKLAAKVGRRRDQAFSQRPSSDPFLSGDTFRSLADHVWDETSSPGFEASDVKAGDIIFVSWHFDRFLFEVAPRITVPFVLITSNSDQSVKTHELEMLRRTTIIRWFAVNVEVLDSRIVAIPLGLESLRLRWCGDRADFQRLRKAPVTRPLRLCWGFAVKNNEKERLPAEKVLKTLWFADKVSGLDPFTYRRRLIEFSFVASPPGNGPDCHRTWEALYLGLIPVVKRSLLTQSFVHRGIPLIEIDDWSELQTWTETTLQSLRDRLLPRLTTPVLFFDYWKALILEAKRTCTPGVSV